jgi:hypothetical protein
MTMMISLGALGRGQKRKKKKPVEAAFTEKVPDTAMPESKVPDGPAIDESQAWAGMSYESKPDEDAPLFPESGWGALVPSDMGMFLAQADAPPPPPPPPPTLWKRIPTWAKVLGGLGVVGGAVVGVDYFGVVDLGVSKALGIRANKGRRR